MSLLKVAGLQKRYKARTVVHDVGFEVGSGEVVGLLGPNGAGKTTCFYMIVGLVRADQGRVRIDDLDVSHQPMHGRARAGIGYTRRFDRFALTGYGEVATDGSVAAGLSFDLSDTLRLSADAHFVEGTGRLSPVILPDLVANQHKYWQLYAIQLMYRF